MLVAIDLSVFTGIEHFQLGDTLEMRTRHCFSDEVKYPCRSKEIDYWLPGLQPRMEPCTVTRIIIGSQRIRFRDLVAMILGAPVEKTIAHFADELIARKHFVSLPQMELLTVSGGKPRQEHYAFMVDKNNHISLVRVYQRSDESFGVNLARAHYAEPGDFLYVRNLDETRFPKSF